LLEPKSRITNAEATVVQKPIREPTRNRAVFDFGGLFLFLFWASKKENITQSVAKINTTLLIFLTIKEFALGSKKDRRYLRGSKKIWRTYPYTN
jgi:hypothetical protein